MEISQEIKDLVPYKPGKSIEETKREYGLDHIFKLASNECPLPPSPQVIQAIQQGLAHLHRYPDPACFELKETVSKYYGVPTDWITFGNGSNELIDLVIRLFCEPKDCIVTSESAFIAYKICAQAARVSTIETPLTSDLRFDLKKLAEKVEDSNGAAKVVFVANPNNPTGTYVTNKEWDQLISALGGRDDVILVLDEAYTEFVRAQDCPNGLDFIKDVPNLILLRTFSKVFGLAGLRVGALVAHPETVSLIDRIRHPFNVNALAQKAAAAALEDREHLEKIQSMNWKGLDYFYESLSALGLPYQESHANFVLFDTKRDAAQVNEELLKRGVIMRPVKNYGLDRHLRLSVGLPEENQAAMGALKEVLAVVPEQ